MAQPLNFQQIIMRLHSFWADHGCVIWNPYNVQVGAGTGNPATLLRVLGPEPWRVAYVEPSVRPDDGRYGENPNRMQYYFQYQVILKPDPGNPQELYLQSLEALGISSREHDIRFVEDNWESPALGAWGLGWEVWMDGQEITQFTYFQQAGGIELEPVSVEITYGLERIALALQDKNSAWEIDWMTGLSYGDMFLQSEIEHCRYYFEIADVESLKEVYDNYESESKRALGEGAIIPAYDYVLKCSHLFNVLDTRGAIGVTERATFFHRMRNMTRDVAKAFALQRETLGHPLLARDKGWNAPALQTPAALPATLPTTPQDFLFEIGVEELPPDDVTAAQEQLEDMAASLFERLRLSPPQGVMVYSTPRRLVLAAWQVPARQPDVEKLEKGPPAARAFDAEGKPTKAAEGFAKGRGIPVEALKVQVIDGGEYVTALVKETGRSAVEVLAEELPKLVGALKFGKTMRWNATRTTFSRPIRWLMALFGETLIPLEVAGVASGRITRGLRPYGSPDTPVKHLQDYLDTLSQQGIILNGEARREAILKQITATAATVKGTIPTDDALLDEVMNLVEAPTALLGTFEKRFLELPRDVLVMVMRKKQRYFPVEDAGGTLMPHFITVRNGDADHLEKVTHGNEQVLKARFADAAFFYADDVKKKLADFLPRLSTLTFQEKLGSMLDKNIRITQLVEPLGKLIKASAADVKTAAQAAAVLKADLAAHMVVEMTDLQGTMGREYALKEGMPAAVAEAIYEHWLPRGAGDKLPGSTAGTILALADRLDSLVGLFAAGLAPKSNTDPYGLRRAALGIIQIVTSKQLDVDLRVMIDLAAQALPLPVSDAVKTDVLDFIAGRFRAWVDEQEWRADVVASVLAAQRSNPYRAMIGLRELTDWAQRPNWEQVLDSFARCVRITRDDKQRYGIRPDVFTESQEKHLHTVYATALTQVPDGANVAAFLNAFEPMLPAITDFFDHVMVNAEDAAVRDNRHGLLQAIAALQQGRADLSHMTGF
jgi:glycyl-tRNA synthetase